MERVRLMRSRSSEGDAVEAVEQAGAEVYLGHTCFTAPDVVEVDGRQLRFRKAVISTGSEPLLPRIEGLQTGEYLTNESVFSLTERPARLVVIGRRPAGLRTGASLPPSRQRGGSRQPHGKPTRWMAPIAGHGSWSFPIAPIPTPKWPKWA
jgi:pyruvate/2-oxoglutarate dehydrogenase complex dihydrolipoamide dehydrogenase (E3) component